MAVLTQVIICIEDSKVKNHEDLSITNIKDVLESFGNTENLTEDQKYFIKYTAEASDKLSGSDLSDLVIELWNKKFNKATHKFISGKYTGFKYKNYFFDYSKYLLDQFKDEKDITYLNWKEILTTLSYGMDCELDFTNFLKQCKVCYNKKFITEEQYESLLHWLISFNIFARCEKLDNILDQSKDMQ